MKVAILNHAGPADSFSVVDLPIPSAKRDQVIVRQIFAGVNFGDVIRRRRGLFPPTPPPYVLGFEGVGIVESVGEGVIKPNPGDRVAYLVGSGCYAEYVAMSADSTWVVPETVSNEMAAGISCVGLTAWGLIRESRIDSGDTALVHGASGGVGSILVQMLVAQGIDVFAVVSGGKKATFASRLGAKWVFDRNAARIEDEIKKHTANGVDVIFDCVGQDVLICNLSVIKPGGVWMYYGSTSGHFAFPGERLLMNRLALRGFVIFDYIGSQSVWRRGTAALASCLASGVVKPQTTQSFPIGRVAEAHEMLESRAAMGKIVLSFDDCETTSPVR